MNTSSILKLFDIKQGVKGYFDQRIYIYETSDTEIGLVDFKENYLHRYP